MRKAKILLVDDEPDFTRNLSMILSRRNYEVSAVNDGLSAINAIEETEFDIVVLDLKMPGIDGIETLKIIKKKQPLIEVIILTGHGTIDTAIQGVEYGAFDYAMKPISVENLNERINQAFERRLLHEKQRSTTAPADEEVTRMPGRINVLLIDDEELFVRNLIQVLGKRGMVVRGANDGATAMKMLTAEGADPYDVIVLDLRMPGLDGVETLKAIRKRDLHTPVILLTGHADLKRVSEALKEGIDEVLLKPCPIDTLVSTIENVHERKTAAGKLQTPG